MILVPLLFLTYVKDFNRASDVLDPITYRDDTNPFIHIKKLKCFFIQ